MVKITFHISFHPSTHPPLWNLGIYSVFSEDLVFLIFWRISAIIYVRKMSTFDTREIFVSDTFSIQRQVPIKQFSKTRYFKWLFGLVYFCALLYFHKKSKILNGLAIVTRHKGFFYSAYIYFISSAGQMFIYKLEKLLILCYICRSFFFFTTIREPELYRWLSDCFKTIILLFFFSYLFVFFLQKITTQIWKISYSKTYYRLRGKKKSSLLD